MITLALAGSLSVIDVVLAHMRMSLDEAGRYAGLATIARFPELVAAPFALVLLVRSRIRVLARSSPLLEFRSIFATTTILLAFAVVLTGLFARQLVGTLLDAESFAPVADLLPVLTLGHALIALAQMVLFFGIAAGTRGLPVVPFVLLAAFVGVLSERGTSPTACAWIVVGEGVLALVFSLFVVVVPIALTRRPGRRVRAVRHSDDASTSN